MADNLEEIYCPACGKKMHKIFMDAQGVNLDVCLDGCGGIFFDNREFKKFDENAEDITPLTNALHRRFCHIYYDIDKDNWFNWAIGSNSNFDDGTVRHTPNKNVDNIIHPAIVSYISNRGEDILSQELDEQNPKIVTDPRKWEIASEILYQTNNPYTLRPAIGNIAEDFAQYCRSTMLTPDDIVNGNYNTEDFEDLNFGDRISTVAGLCNAEEKDLTPVRQFIYDQFGKEILSTYDSMWSNNDPIKEIECAQDVLQSLGLGQYGVEIISCPTCGRTEVGLIELANKVEVATKSLKKNIKIAVI